MTAHENYYPSDPDMVGTLEQRYSRTGKRLFSERKKTPEPEFKPYAEYSFIEQLPEEENGFEREVDGVTYIIPEWSRKHGGKPYLIKVIGEMFEEIELEWKRDHVGSVIDVVFKGGKVYFYVERGRMGEPELWIHRFSMETFKEEAAAHFNARPETIWGMAVTSNLLVHDGYCYVATVSTDFFCHRLELGVWDGHSAECDSKNLTRKIDWNTSLHMANIGNDALIAYHYPGGRPRRSFLPSFRMKRKDANVHTVHFKLTQVSYSPT